MAAEVYRLKLYEDDGTTVAVEFSTDPAHARPYLLPPENLASQDVDMATGRATIGGCSVELVDVAITPADPDTGYVTSILADVAGKTARIGRRAHLEVLIGASYENVLNGVIEGIELHESYSSFTLSLKDQRENERHIHAFTRTTTPSVYPRGVVDGFGYNAVNGSWLVPPTTPLRANFTSAAGPFSWSVGLLQFEEPAKDSKGRYVPTADRILTKVQEDALRHSSSTEWAVLDQIRLLWRPTGGGAWHILEGLRQDPGGNYLEIAGGTYTRPTGAHAEVDFLVNFLFNFLPGADLPASGTDIDIILGYAGPTSEEWPFHLEGLTFGEALQNLYDGDYSEDGVPPIQYESAAVLALTEPLRARITEPADSEDGIWKWTEDNICAPLGAAPALNSQGRISPVRYRLPPVGAVLLQLDDTNCEPLPGWNHSGSDAVNVATVEYERVYAVASDQDPAGKGADGDGLVSRKVTVEYRDISSIAFLGERPVRIKAATLVALGGSLGEPITGDVADETGAQLAKLRTRELTDRFLLGGQHFHRRVARSALGSRRAGDWCTDATSWTPNYLTGQRGAGALAQIVRVQPLDTTWSEVELIDAGPDNAPVGAPTLGSVTVNTAGIVSVPVTVVAAGSEARVDYAISTLEPAADSPLWLMVDPRTAVAATLMTPAVPAGAVVWIRARGEKEGRRPSAWTTAVTVTAPSTPRVSLVRVVVDQTDGSVVVTWEPNTYALGVRLHYDAHDPLDPPGFATQDVIASAGTYAFAAGTVALGQMFTVDVEPYTGWTGSAVSGTAGVKIRGSNLLTGEAINAAAPVLQIHAVLSANQDTADISIKVSSAAAEGTRIHYHDDESTSSPTIWSLVASNGSAVAFFAANNSVVDASNWFYNGTTWAQKLNDIPLTRDQIERIFLQGEGQTSGIKSLWVPFAIDVKGVPWLESVDFVFDEINDKLKCKVRGGARCASIKAEFDDDPAFGSIASTQYSNLSDGGSVTLNYPSASSITIAERNKPWYVRVTPYNGALSGTPTGLAGEPQEASARVEGNVGKEFYIPATAFRAVGGDGIVISGTYYPFQDYSNGYLQTLIGLRSDSYDAPLELADAVDMTSFSARLYCGQDSSDFADILLIEQLDDSQTQIGSTGSHTGTGWQTVTVNISATNTNGRRFLLRVITDCADTSPEIRVAWGKVVYNMPTPANTR